MNEAIESWFSDAVFRSAPSSSSLHKNTNALLWRFPLLLLTGVLDGKFLSPYFFLEFNNAIYDVGVLTRIESMGIK